MYALEVINAINKPEAPKIPTGATIIFSGVKLIDHKSVRCPGACGSVKGHPRHGMKHVHCDCWGSGEKCCCCEKKRRWMIQQEGINE